MVMLTDENRTMAVLRTQKAGRAGLAERSEQGGSVTFDTNPAYFPIGELYPAMKGSLGKMEEGESETTVQSSAAAAPYTDAQFFDPTRTFQGSFRFTSAVSPFAPARLSQAQRSRPTDERAIRIQRAHFVNQILSDLRQIQPQCGQPGAARYADSLLRTMRTMGDLTPADPFIEVVFALHDALAHRNRWIAYQADQYEAAWQILRKAAQRVTTETIEKAIMELENAGFETTPFEVTVDFDEDDSDS